LIEDENGKGDNTVPTSTVSTAAAAAGGGIDEGALVDDAADNTADVEFIRISLHVEGVAVVESDDAMLIMGNMEEGEEGEEMEEVGMID